MKALTTALSVSPSAMAPNSTTENSSPSPPLTLEMNKQLTRKTMEIIVPLFWIYIVNVSHEWECFKIWKDFWHPQFWLFWFVDIRGIGLPFYTCRWFGWTHVDFLTGILCLCNTYSFSLINAFYLQSTCRLRIKYICKWNRIFITSKQNYNIYWSNF